MTVYLRGIGTATPRGILTQDRAIQMARVFAPKDVPDAVIELLHRRTGILSRAAVIIDSHSGTQSLYAVDGAGRGPTTAVRLAIYAREASALAREASAAALDDAGVLPEHITHVITVSCTGFSAPGVDQALVHNLGLSPGVGRTHIGFMGCHGAINGMAVARSIALADPAATVLLCCVELCSLHMHYSARRDQLIANSLFADGAAAALISQKGDAGSPEVRACASRLLTDSVDAMSWRIGDHGFEMTLAAEVPDKLTREVPGWIDSILHSCGVRRHEVGGWAVHPGGPKIVEGIAASLELGAGSIEESLAVLREHGNMSSPTVLFILARMMKYRTPRPWVTMAFGPGLAAEAAVLV